ncbi:MAG: hypothetical protein IV097_18565 [Burkholderiaceae bacterium]|nr:hypothetical protein [Burkholderiaceae bacterium]
MIEKHAQQPVLGTTEGDLQAAVIQQMAGSDFRRSYTAAGMFFHLRVVGKARFSQFATNMISLAAGGTASR